MKIFFYILRKNDFFHQCFKKKKKIYLINNSSLSFSGSVNNISLEYECLKKWHWEWSKYYFYNKHYNKIIIFFIALESLVKFSLKSSFIIFIIRIKIRYLDQIRWIINLLFKKRKY